MERSKTVEQLYSALDPHYKMPDTLSSEQTNYGSGPQLTSAQRETLPDLMQELHFRHVSRATYGLVTCSTVGQVTTCALLGRIPLLIFREDSTTVEEDHLERRWRVTGGRTVRAGSESIGVFSLGVRLRRAVANRMNWTAWVRVEDFPSRFLGLWPDTRLRLLGSFIAAGYRAIHSYVSRGYLKRLGRRLDAGDIAGHG